MTQFTIAVISLRRARLLTFNNLPRPGNSGPDLVQVQEIVNPIQSEQGKAMWAEIMAGNNQTIGLPALADDDCSDRQVSAYERRFVEAVVRATMVLTSEQQSHCIVLAAEANLMGLVRRAVSPFLLKGMLVKEINQDLDHLTLPELKQYLMQQDLLPDCVPVDWLQQAS